MGRYSKLVIKFWIVMAVVGCGIFLFTEKTEKASMEKISLKKLSQSKMKRVFQNR